MITEHVKKKAGFVLGILGVMSLSLCLSACLTENDGEDGDFSMETDVAVMSITPPQGEVAGTIITRSSEYDCDGTTLITETYNDTSRYVIDDGKLYLWYDEQCYVDIVLTGSSSTITGKWTTSSFSASVPVPEAYRPEECEDEEEFEDAFTEIFQNVTAHYTISSSTINSKLSGTLCFTPIYADVFAALGDGLRITTSSTCESATLTDTVANKTATVTSVHQDDMIVTTFSHGDSVCTMSEPFMFSDEPPMCSEAGGGGEGGDTFFDCMLGSGFYAMEEPLETDTTMTEKRATNGSVSNPAAAVREVLRKAAGRLP